MKFSAYLSVFDDYDLLGPAMAKIAPRLDEIVVVDGAYGWMAPFFAASGRDGAYSCERLRDVMAPYAAKTRWINQLWDNEPAKRAAGFAACQHRWIWRLDADEIHFIDDAALDRFFANGRSVGEMELPLYIAPGWVRARPGQPFERNALLFDATRIDAQAHLAHLWLVTPEAERLRIPAPDLDAVGDEPISFSAHLTGWRPPGTAVARARFYVMNWLREHGAAWPGSPLRYDGLAGFAPMLAAVPPAALTDILLGHAIVAGLPEMGDMALIPTPLGPEAEAGFAGCYDRYLAGLAALNAAGAHSPRTIEAGVEYMIDLSTPGAAAPFLRDGALHFAFAQTIASARAVMRWLYPGAPFVEEAELAVAIDGGAIRAALPAPARPALRPALRQVVGLTAWPAEDAALLQLRAGA